MDYKLRPITAGQAISQAVNIYMDNFLLYFGITLLFVVPSFIFREVLIIPWYNLGPFLGTYTNTMVSSLVGNIFGVFAIGIIQSDVASRFKGTESGLGMSFRRVVVVAVPLVISSVVVYIGTQFLLLLLLVPGFIFVVAHGFVTEFVLLDGRSFSEAMRESRELTKGSRWRVFGYTMLAGLFVTLPTAVTTAVLSRFQFQGVAPLLLTLLRYIVSSLLSPVANIFMLLLFFDLKKEYQSINIEKAWSEAGQESNI